MKRGRGRPDRLPSGRRDRETHGGDHSEGSSVQGNKPPGGRPLWHLHLHERNRKSRYKNKGFLSCSLPCDRKIPLS